MEISRLELDRLNFYRASELHGGLVLGRVVARVRDPELVLELTRHSAEEVLHAQLWTETILAVGGEPLPVRETYQRRYAAVIGAPASLLDILALTQVFERRVYRHFLEHARLRETHPEVRATLLRMVEEEKHHLSWVKRWLDRQAEKRPAEVADKLRHYTAVDASIYERLAREYSFGIEVGASG
jgi:demethoxyubiquinone hydroxylase (CLK1/Coq7/Cat5 family)